MTAPNIEVDGAETSPALLLVHGFMSSTLQWEPNREALREHFRVIAVDLWGHGASPAPRDSSHYSVDAYLSTFETIRRRLGIDTWFVCGQSFGAGITIRYALKHRQAVRGLIVTNSRSALNDVTSETEATGNAVDWQAVDLRSLPYHPCHAKRFPAALKSQMEVAADRIDRHALWQAMQVTARGLSCRDAAKEISVPTLLVNGRFEKAFQGDRDFAIATIPDLEVADLDAGHSVNIEAPKDFSEAVIDFAERHA